MKAALLCDLTRIIRSAFQQGTHARLTHSHEDASAKLDRGCVAQEAVTEVARKIPKDH